MAPASTITNGNGVGSNGDIESNAPSNPLEVTPLLNSSPGNESRSSTQSESNASTSVSNSIEDALADETNNPWPSTFERSISLLAMTGPHSGGAKDVDLMTRSPLRSVTPKMLMQRRKGRDPMATPDWMPKKLIKRHSAGHSMETGKIAGARPQIDLEQKMREAKAYRQKILQQQAGTGIVTKAQERKRRDEEEEESALYSPGMKKEKETDRRTKEAAGKAPTVDGKSSVSSCVFNLANILMGVGMLGLPFVFKSAGWVGGWFVLISFAAVTWRTSILIGRELNGDPRPGHIFDDSPFKTPLPPGSCHEKARMRKPIQSFPDIARESFGDKGTVILSTVLYFELFSCLAIFFVSLGEHMNSLFPAVSITEHEIIMAVALAVPTVVLNTPRLLSYLSAVGTFATISVVAAVVISAARMGDISKQVSLAWDGRDQPPYHSMWRTSGLPLALGLVAYCFSGHAIVPSIYTSMKNPQYYERMVDFTFLIVVTCCLVVAVSGYYMFGSVVDDQITISLAKLAPGGFAVSALTWLMVLTAFSKFTLTMFPLALGMEEIVAPLIPNDAVKAVASYIIRFGLIILALMVAIFVPSFSFLCSLVGLICTMIVSVIFPAAAHLKLFGEKLSTTEKVIDYAFIIFGFFSAIVGTIATV